MTPPTSHVKWQKTYRLLNSCYPPCDVWEDIISSGEDWALAFEIEQMTNPRARQELGEIHLIPPDRMLTGPNSWYVISAFCHFSENGSRFADGTFGAYYAANDFTTAVKEKAYGFTQQFLSATEEPIIDIKCRTLVGKIDALLHDIRFGNEWNNYYLTDDYTHSQKLAKQLRTQNSNGIVYQSVRNQGGECFAAFWPDVVSIPTQERHIIYHWNGKQITDYSEIRHDTNAERVSI